MRYAIRKPELATRKAVATLADNLSKMGASGNEKKVAEVHAMARHMALTDLYFLGVYVLNRPDALEATENAPGTPDWVFDRCREVQAAPNNHLDLWAREHFKSTIITHWLTIQDILNDPEVTFGIFSHTRPIAKAFLRAIKLEFERNEWLKALFPDVLFDRPARESPKWSEDEGIIVKRKGNPKEATVEAWGLVDGQPTSKHYGVLLYDDVVTRESVTNPVKIATVTSSWELSTNLGKSDGIRRFAGTHYHFNDTYKAILKKNAATPRIYPCTKDGSVHGEPVLLSKAYVAKKRSDQGPFNFGAQMLLNPKADDVQGFKDDWLRTYGRVSGDRMVKAILVDGASSKKKGSDYTAAICIGLAEDENIYVLEGRRDRLNLSQRWDMLKGMHRTWKPIKTGYEKYGKDSDIEHFNTQMEREEYRFRVEEVGGQMGKDDRIKRLIPYFEQGRIWLPVKCWQTDYEGKRYDWTEVFTEEEYKAFPVCAHDDILDALARIFDLWPNGLPFPRARGGEGSRAKRDMAETEYDEFEHA